MPKRRVDVFYAYPSQPPSLGETILAALNQLKRGDEITRAQVRFKPWPDMAVVGTRLVKQIADSIAKCDVFACDVTYPNSNVAFELGFATSTFKRLWISLDATRADSEAQYKRLYTGMTGAAYGPYENHQDLAESFLRERPWSSLDQHLLSETYRRQAPRPESPTLLYVRPQMETSAVIEVAEYLRRSVFADALVVDNPRENAAPTLVWYVDKIQAADAIVVHFVADDQRAAVAHNTKAAFVAGLAHGFRKDLLLLAHAPFVCPTDFQSLLRTHETAKSAEDHLAGWIEELQLAPRRPRRPEPSSLSTAPRLELRNLSLGEPVAENESLRLDGYFVETSEYFAALEAQTSVLVGRRGTGKTATFLALQAAIGRNPENHVCAIKPVGYEVDGLLRLLSEDWRSAERGHLIESLWKYLIYTELAGSVVAEINDRPIHHARTPEETRFLEYVESKSDILLAPFSQRLNRAVSSLLGTATLSATEDQRAKISEFLHVEYLRTLRKHLGDVLSHRKQVAILIDNLDEPWVPGRDPGVLSSLLLGLLRETQNILTDLQHHDNRRRSINVSVTVFIRSDIFAYIQPLSNEQDKWPLRRVSWNDPALLLRVVEERLRSRVPPSTSAEELWSRFFPVEVVGLPVRQFIVQNTMHRPRDVIYLVKEAISSAVNRGHVAVTEQDMLDAREKYSRFVLASVLAEDDPAKWLLEGVLFEFAGVPKRLSRTQVMDRIAGAGVTQVDSLFYLNLLCDINFLAIQTKDGFRFAAEENDRQLLLRVAERLSVERGWGGDSFEINPAFFQALQIAG